MTTPDHVLADARWLRENYDEQHSAQFMPAKRVRAICDALLAAGREPTPLAAMPTPTPAYRDCPHCERQLIVTNAEGVCDNCGRHPLVPLLAPRGSFKSPRTEGAPIIATPVCVPEWYPWHALGSEAETMRDAWRLARVWLSDFNVDLGSGHEPTFEPEPPSAMAYTDRACLYAFRIADEGDQRECVVVLVEIDEDPPARAVRVEVRRG